MALSPALELAALLAIVIAAIAVRVPELAVVPRTTDEASEFIWGLRVARDESFPLTNDSPSIGALFNYLLAAAFLLFGPSLEVARGVVMLLGALTTVPTYLLGRSIGGGMVGLLAALLLATSATHIAVNSHIAWSNATTPFFCTIALWLLHRAVSQSSGPALIGSAAAFGLGLQTHPPTVPTLLPGLVMYLFWHGRLWERHARLRSWLIPAMGAVALTTLNLIIFNVATGMESFTVQVREAANPLGGAPMPPTGWLSRLGILLPSLATSLAGMVSEEATARQALYHPFVMGYTVLALTGLVILTRRRETLPLLVGVSVMLSLPIATGYLEPVVNKSRYFASLLPLGYVAVAIAVHRFCIALLLVPSTVRGSGLLRRCAAAALVAALALMPLVMLGDYYLSAERAGLTNRTVFQAIDAVDRGRQARETVYIDRHLRAIDTADGGSLFNPVRLLLEARGYPYRQIDVEAGVISGDRSRGTPRLLVLWGGNVAQVERLYRLEPIPGEPGPRASIRVVRATREALRDDGK